jgi:chromate reductase, NAD(P)H dehydrogenase (quinone)
VPSPAAARQGVHRERELTVSVLLISGSLRSESSNAAALRTAAALAPPEVETTLFDGMANLPHFNPDDDAEGGDTHPAVADLRAAISRADAILICTPEYAGALPGALKNLLEWTIGDGGTYGKPVAWINVSGPAAPTGGADAHDSLRKVLTYSGADIVEQACLRVPLTRQMVGGDGLIEDAQARERIGHALEQLARAS